MNLPECSYISSNGWEVHNQWHDAERARERELICLYDWRIKRCFYMHTTWFCHLNSYIAFLSDLGSGNTHLNNACVCGSLETKSILGRNHITDNRENFYAIKRQKWLSLWIGSKCANNSTSLLNNLYDLMYL